MALPTKDIKSLLKYKKDSCGCADVATLLIGRMASQRGFQVQTKKPFHFQMPK